MNEDLPGILRKHGVLLEGHFLLASGRHSARYFEKFRILEHPQLCETFSRTIADRFRDDDISVVCGPTTGGIIIAYEVARQLGTRCVIAEPADRGRRIGRGFQVNGDDRVLVVDDVMTTGGSIVDTLAALRSYPGRVAGIGVFIDRSGGSSRLQQPYFAVYEQSVETFPEEDCPLCRDGMPLTKPGRSSDSARGS
ncbi:MAG: orotate phosphoribosyltransferase [candidate division WOR-3 bacterium]|nr:MAG: orotate phosphoribosyltransferase [candidate division WOR-3 bacterium]